MLKFYEIEGRFPAYPEEIPQAAVGYIASLETTGSPASQTIHHRTDTPMRARRDTSGQKPRLEDADFAAAAYTAAAAALFRARGERLLSCEDIGGQYGVAIRPVRSAGADGETTPSWVRGLEQQRPVTRYRHWPFRCCSSPESAR
jgi:hypothetical protein